MDRFGQKELQTWHTSITKVKIRWLLGCAFVPFYVDSLYRSLSTTTIRPLRSLSFFGHHARQNQPSAVHPGLAKGKGLHA